MNYTVGMASVFVLAAGALCVSWQPSLQSATDAELAVEVRDNCDLVPHIFNENYCQKAAVTCEGGVVTTLCEWIDWETECALEAGLKGLNTGGSEQTMIDLQCSQNFITGDCIINQYEECVEGDAHPGLFTCGTKKGNGC